MRTAALFSRPLSLARLIAVALGAAAGLGAGFGSLRAPAWAAPAGATAVAPRPSPLIYPAEAIPLLERRLAYWQWMMGADHQNTLRSRINLAMGYRAAGRTAEAILLLEETVADCERVLGADHPDTKAARDDLAALTGEPEMPRHT